MTILLSIEKLNNEDKKVILFALSIYCLTVVLVYLYLWFNDLPNYRMVYNTKTEKFGVEEKKWYGYITIEAFKYQKFAERMVTEYNNLKK